MVLIFRDVTEQRRQEQLRNARLAVTHALNQATTVQDAATGVLRAMCENLAWDAGFFWHVDEERTPRVSRAMAQARCPAVAVRRPQAAAHVRSAARGFLAASGPAASRRGFRIWRKRHNFARARARRRSGLHSAFALPRHASAIARWASSSSSRSAILRAGSRPVGDDGLGRCQLRPVHRAKVAEDDLRRSEADLADFFENATVGLHWVGPGRNNPAGQPRRARHARVHAATNIWAVRITEFHADAKRSATSSRD